MKPVKKLKLPVKQAAETAPDHIGPTERRWMAHKQKDRMFEILTVMAEDNNRAFDILMLVFELGADALFHDVAITLDDMNIRGEQIVIAWEHVPTRKALTGTLIENFVHLVMHRDDEMIAAINAQWAKAFMERAVPSGAHKWMHKKIVTPPSVG